MIFYFPGTGNSLSAAEKLLLPGEQLVSMATVNQIESFSPPIFASWCSKNGETCIDRLTRYKKLIGPMRFLVTKEKNKRVSSVWSREMRTWKCLRFWCSLSSPF